jgi:hypothetical protein
LAYTSASVFAHQDNADWLIEFRGQLKNCFGQLWRDPPLEPADVYSGGSAPSERLKTSRFSTAVRLYEAHYQGDGDMEQQRPERCAKNKSQQPYDDGVDGDARQFGVPRLLGVHFDIASSLTDIGSVDCQVGHGD